VPVSGDDPADPAAAAVWGLVRSAQAEHPGRFALVDSDGSEASEAALEAALAIEDEPQVALRQGAASAPRLARLAEPAEAPPLGPEGTVLITGGTGALGAIFARHLVTAHGVRHLVLSGRRGPDAPGAAALVAELSALGAEVEAVACDAADRAQLEALIAAIPAERPLRAVLHAAAVFDNGLVDSLDPERLAPVMAPKATAAWHLHELTRDVEGCELILFSSIAGSFQNPGQGNYAAANAFLDGLAAQRRAEGLPGQALVWGLWDAERVAQDELEDADQARLRRAGVAAMSSEQALGLFDRARAGTAAVTVAAALETATLRSLARAGELAPILRGLVRAPARRARAGSLADRLAAVAPDEREALVVELVRTHAAAVLGHSAAAAVDPEAAFRDLGFDSLAAVELRNRLGQATGLRLPSTLAFDYPNAAAAAGFLLGQVEGPAAPVDTDRKLDTITSILGSIAVEERDRATARLQAFLTGLSAEGREESRDEDEVDLDSASDEEIMRMIDGELGKAEGRR
jgi:NADP-dependent 3-hydroxy acid dehydrogenase YdfG/acyl carrier protein